MSELPEHLSMIRDSSKKLLARELLPLIENSEKTGEFPKSVLIKLAEQGLAAPMLPEPYGTEDLFAQAAVAEEMGFCSSSFGLSALASICLFGANVGRQGTEEQKKKYLPGIASGQKIGCWALTEPGVGSDAVSIQTRSVRKGDRYVIQGSKNFITNAPIADYFIALTREHTEDGKPISGFGGGTAFILERGMPGLRVGKPLQKLGHQGSPTSEVFLENVEVSKEQILGKPGTAFSGMKISLDVERAIFSALGVGIISFCLDSAVRYASQRKQFGVAISEHQMIQEKIAEMSASLDLIRTYQNHVIQKIMGGKSANKEAAILKLMGARYAFQAANEAVQCLGGYGYMKEYQVERFLRDAKLFEIGGGTNEIQKMIIAKQTIREILGNENGS